MRILLVGNYPADQQKSMIAFAKMMERCLIDEGYYVKIVNPTSLLLPKNVRPYGFWKWIAYIDKFLFFPLILRWQVRNFDLVHICDHSNAIYTLFLKNMSTVVTCHDVLAIEAARDLIPGWRVRAMGKVFQRLIFLGLNRAAAVVCVSEYTKLHLKNLGWSGRNVSVALNALNADFYPADRIAVEEAVKQVGFQVDEKYFVHVGSDLSRKNRIFVLKIFNLIKSRFPDSNFKLLFIGPPFSMEMKDILINNNLNNFVFAIQNATHTMLRSLYSGAVGLIFPSLQEGFGWPIIEAQACGCPVFTSNILPMTEVGGNGAIYIDPVNENIAVDRIIESLNDLGSIRKRGFENIKRFSKSNLVQKYLTAYISATESNKC